YLTILDSDGKPIAQSKTEPFELQQEAADNHHDPAKLIAFLTEHQAKYLDAKAVRDAAFARARQEGKRVFLHFGAPWCGRSHRLEDWLARPEIAALLAKDFVDLKIDEDRMTGGKQMKVAEQTAAGVQDIANTGMPWFVLCAADGRQLANSGGAQDNLGFPSDAQATGRFASMLEQARVNLTAADIETLAGSLTAIRAADERKKQDAGH